MVRKKLDANVMEPQKTEPAIDLDKLYNSNVSSPAQNERSFGLGGSSSVSAAFSSTNFLNQTLPNSGPIQSNNSPFQNNFQYQNKFAQSDNGFLPQNSSTHQNTRIHQNAFMAQGQISQQTPAQINNPFSNAGNVSNTNPFENLSQGFLHSQQGTLKGTSNVAANGPKEKKDVFDDL